MPLILVLLAGAVVFDGYQTRKMHGTLKKIAEQLDNIKSFRVEGENHATDEE